MAVRQRFVHRHYMFRTMKNFKFLSVAFVLSLTASIGCQTAETAKNNVNVPAATNVPSKTAESSSQTEKTAVATAGMEKVRDYAVEKALSAGFSASELNEIRYAYKKIDLDGDGILDAIVVLRGSAVCGSGGCQLHILKGVGSGYNSFSEIGPVQGGFSVLESKTKGWRDLVVSIGGGGGESGDVVLQFDGKKYPENPTTIGKFLKGKEKTIFTTDDSLEKNLFPLSTEKTADNSNKAKNGLLTCLPGNLKKGDVLTVSMKTPHGGFLKIVTPDKKNVFLSEEDGDNLVEEAAKLGAEPYFPQSKFAALNELKLSTSEATTVDYERGEVAGKLRLRPIFMSSGVYKIILSSSSFEQDEPDIEGQCEVNYHN